MRARIGALVAAGVAIALSGACVEAELPGQLDATFANGSRATSGFTAIAVATEPLGTVYVLGTASNCVSATSGQDFAIVHYLIDGTLDVSFGDTGETCIDFSSATESPRWIGVDQTNKVLVAGSAGDSGTFGVVARLMLTGEQDTTFGNGGIVTLTDASSYVAQVSVVSTGLIVAEVSTQTPGTSTLVALDATGAVSGVPRHLQVPAQAAASVGMTVDGSGLLVAQSAAASSGAHSGFAVSSVTAAGALSSSFGVGGTAYASLSSTGADIAQAVALQSGAEIVVAGPVAVPSGGSGAFDVGVTRFRPDGSNDGSAVAGPSGSGVARIGSVQWRVGQQTSGLAVQADGRLLLAGSTPAGNAVAGQDAVVERLTSGAQVDATYGTQGTWTSGVAGDDYVLGAELDFSGKLVVLATGATGSTYYLYRINP